MQQESGRLLALKVVRDISNAYAPLYASVLPCSVPASNFHAQFMFDCSWKLEPLDGATRERSKPWSCPIVLRSSLTCIRDQTGPKSAVQYKETVRIRGTRSDSKDRDDVKTYYRR